jgi:Domain of unknown function (DUF5664)
MIEFKDTEGNSIAVGDRYTDNEGYTFVVTEVNDNEMICQYDDKFQGLNGIVRWNAHNIDMFGAYFTKGSIDVSPFQKVLKAVDSISVSTKQLEAAVEPTSIPTVAPGRKYDAGKPMYNLLPADALEEVVKVLTAGAIKYNEPIDQENWRLVSNPQSRYFAAAQRHQWADQRGEFIDEGTQESPGTMCYHLACAITSLMFKLQLRIEEDKTKKGNQ